MMANLWLPPWLRLVGVVMFAAILAVHLWHVVTIRDSERHWHGVHVLMALGMLTMILPTGGVLISGTAGTLVFAVAALMVLGLGARGAYGGRPWLASAGDLAAMACMFAATASPNAWLTLPAAAWCAAQSVGWATGRLGRVPCSVREDVQIDVRGNGHRAGSGTGERTLPAESGAAGTVTTSTTRTDGFAARGRGTGSEAAATAAAHASARIALTLMAAGMVYMFLAMQFGAHTMHSM